MFSLQLQLVIGQYSGKLLREKTSRNGEIEDFAEKTFLGPWTMDGVHAYMQVLCHTYIYYSCDVTLTVQKAIS